MSQERRARDYSRIADADVRDLRRGNTTPSVVAGYLPGNAGRAKPHPGDEKFPFSKDPPDIEGPFRYSEPDVALPAVTTAADYLILDPIDVSGWRLLTLFIDYTAGDSGVLSMMPGTSLIVDRGDEPDAFPDSFYPIGVVDGTIVASTVVPCGGTRVSYATELTFPLGASISPFCRESLVFDVGPYQWFRFAVGDTGAADSTANFFYNVMR